ncbi:GRAS family protein [Larkinella humicola]|uniref:GRAS family protein n=1 Tax=Larkinella humicola TaxID=2607654 RepID=A0A5N1JCM4_9BACT|nr:GRAS family protein [Larkinella humicola]KAA9353039.1 GRAS family protein [Larkinella humicola]
MTASELGQFVDSLHESLAPLILKKLEEQLQTSLLQIENRPEALLDTLFLKAIRDHVQPQAGSHEHLYLQQYEIPQIILFDLLINQLPFVVMSHALTNRAMVNELKLAEQAVVMDVGIGRGIQIARLIDELVATRTRLKHLTVVGVEPFADAVAYAETLIRQAAEKAPFSVEFMPVVSLVEELAPDALLRAFPKHYDVLVVNSSLTIHHLPTVAQRQAFFHFMRSVRPNALLLTEPHSNHLEPDWRRRTLNAYEHYRAVFGVIDGLAIDRTAKNGLKMFFGREIDDVVGNPDDSRFEKHQEGYQWVRYLQESDFWLQPNLEIPASFPPSPVTLRTHPDGYLVLEHDGVTVVSIFRAVAGGC